MSEVNAGERSRRMRAEGRRSVAAILDAAVRILGERPQASMDEVASGAGVSRQTVYAHFPSRDALLRAVARRLTAQAVAALDAAQLDQGPAAEALLRLLDVNWRTFAHFPLLSTVPEADAAELHVPVFERLERLIRRGQRAGEFDPGVTPAWLIAATVALGHTAGNEVAAGRMSAADAEAALRASVLRVYGATPTRPTHGGEPAA
ncbi:AcrR family transcriptional regulator [Micromonospora sp. A200]|uniref:TetR/AcrR family transcriptional regulator n=1 Tax=Micromonospora sp. A200 TaxID=2940568 RepID=UPI00247328C7|nr:TetR/AcrR family transcriptional regulator [Micromonospora sp. A200]MDH6462264.1 AcrR family transcriptional regulator [Micromonospora sp. A200]